MPTTLPSILIGIPTDLSGSFRPFDVCLTQLVYDTLTEPRPYTLAGAPYFAMTGVVPAARCRVVREAIKRGADYIWWLDDDQPFAPGDLPALFAHGLDAVVPLSPRRSAPFLPLLIDGLDADGHARQRWMAPGDAGLVPVVGAGMAGLLIKTSCFAAMGVDGWFEFTHPPGDFQNYAEDYPFYQRLKTAGVQLWADLDVRFGHAVTAVAYIVKQQGQWVTVLADHEPFVGFPQPSHPLGVPAAGGVRRVTLQ